MRAVVAQQPGGPEVLELTEIAIPEPGPDEIRLRVAYASLNPLDTHTRARRVAYKASAFPYTPGFEFSGLVDAVGANVDPSLIGSRRTFLGAPGGCAEYALAPVGSPYCAHFEIPDDLDWKLATVMPCAVYTPWHLIHTAARVRSGDTVLFHGAAGTVAVVGAQIAKHAGARVLGLCSSHEKAAFARLHGGVDEAIISTGSDWVAEVMRVTGGRGADLIVDGVAGENAPLNLEALAPLGQVIYIGAIGGTAPPVDVSSQLYAKSLGVRAFLVYVAMQETAGVERPAILDALRSGRLKVPITGVWQLDQVAELHRRFENRELIGKQVIEIGGEL
jgi:NADPH2:quinone reductase